MKFFITTIMTLLFGFTAFAGFGGYQSTTNLGVFSNIKCSTGMTCSKVGDKFQLTSTLSGVLPGIVSQSTAATLTGSDCGKSVFNPVAISVNLPTGAAAILGCKIDFVVDSGAMYINPDNASKIYPSTSAGFYVTNSGKSNHITLQYISAGNWFPVNVSGTWNTGN